MTATTDIARVTIISTSRRIDLALPGNTTLAELLPSIVRFAGQGAGTDALQQWVIQRIGEDPFDPFVEVADLGISDGETLHLRHREATMPDAAFDDVVDGITTGTSSQPAWSNEDGQRFGLVALAVLLIGVPGAAAVLANSVAVSAGVMVLSAVCGFVSILLARTLGLRPVSGVLAWNAVALAGAAGATIFAPLALPVSAIPIAMLTAATAVLFAATATALGTQVTAYELMGVAMAAAVVVVVAIISTLQPEWFLASSTIGLTVVLVMTPALPGWSFSLAKVAMPNLPTTADALMADRQPVQADIVERAIAADRFLAGLALGTSVAAVTLSSVVVLSGSGWAPTAFILAAGVALLLRARSFLSRPTRLALLTGGSVVTLMGLSRLLLTLPPMGQVVVGTILVLGAGALLTSYSATLYGKILSPVWGRWGDIFEWIAIMSLIPLALAVINLYGWAFGLAG